MNDNIKIEAIETSNLQGWRVGEVGIYCLRNGGKIRVEVIGFAKLTTAVGNWEVLKVIGDSYGVGYIYPGSVLRAIT